MSKAWSHLPNAHHIDWVLASLKENPELWAAARDAAWSAAWSAAWDAARNAARDAAWSEAWSAARNEAGDAVWDMARGVIAALVAYDDCDHFLSMSYERLKVWAAISEDPRAILLLPMAYVREQLMSNAWSHLPNAHHIDWVLKSLKERQELWFAAISAAKSAVRAAARAAARVAARDAAWDAHSGTTWFSARDAARDAAWDAHSGTTWFWARDAARTSIAALIAWDDCDHFLNMSYEKLKVWAVLSEDPRAVLLLPMAYVKEKLNEQSLVTSA